MLNISDYNTYFSYFQRYFLRWIIQITINSTCEPLGSCYSATWGLLCFVIKVHKWWNVSTWQAETKGQYMQCIVRKHIHDKKHNHGKETCYWIVVNEESTWIFFKNWRYMCSWEGNKRCHWIVVNEKVHSSLHQEN